MKASDLSALPCLELLTPQMSEENEICDIYCGDLLSDVLSCAKESSVWITVQSHKNVAAVASMAKIACIVLSKSAISDKEMLNLCCKEKIAVFQSSKDTFLTAVAIYEFLK